MPMISGIHPCFKSSDGNEKVGQSVGDTPNRGARNSVTVAENATDVADMIKIMGEIRWCASSIAKRMPEIGAPVATEKPAQAPPVIA